MFVPVLSIVLLGSFRAREGLGAAPWPKSTVAKIRYAREVKFLQVRKLSQDFQNILRSWIDG